MAKGEPAFPASLQPAFAAPRWVTLEELRRRRSYKWLRYPPDVLPTFVAEMDVTLAEPVTRALIDAIAAGDAGYAYPEPALFEAAAAFHRTRFGWEFAPEAVTMIGDVMSGVVDVIQQALVPGSGVIVNPPVYPPFFSHIAEAGVRVVEAPLARSGAGYVLDLDAVEAAFAAGARAYLLCNPHNPTGLVLSPVELRGVAELAERFHALVLADEIHAPLTLRGAHHTPYLSLPEGRLHGVAFVSATKAWNLPGLRCAQLVTASPPMRELAGRIPEDHMYRAGNLGVVASAAAYRDGTPWLDQLILMLEANRLLLARLLAERLPQVVYAPQPATYLAWLDCAGLGLAEDPAAVFLRRGRVALRPGPDFGSGGAGWVRMTMATAPEILTEMVERMRSAIG
ncbi:MAG TPA: aminotransferase class I/II-fold pyridoxal phosphate-dependent enzyme [Candidatus Binatia bacterium]|nr:aminotransferase class I/II-fold pyridoxal phosphate-dependent enzyme [Candidatus Binatia bacterium]